MQYYLKFSYSFVLVGLLSTSCQKEAPLILDRPVSIVSTSGGQSNSSSPQARHGAPGGNRIITNGGNPGVTKKTTTKHAVVNGRVTQTIVKEMENILGQDGVRKKVTRTRVWNGEGQMTTHKTTYSNYNPNTGAQASGAAGTSDSQRPQ